MYAAAWTDLAGVVLFAAAVVIHELRGRAERAAESEPQAM